MMQQSQTEQSLVIEMKKSAAMQQQTQIGKLNEQI